MDQSEISQREIDTRGVALPAGPIRTLHVSDLKQHDGSFLYRYTPPTIGGLKPLSHIKSILLGHQLYFSSPWQFRARDPRDARPSFLIGDRAEAWRIIEDAYRDAHSHLEPGELARQVARGKASLEGLTDEQLAEEMVKVYPSDTYRICCMTKAPDSDFHWSEYAGRATGCCFEFANTPVLVAGALILCVDYGPPPTIDFCKSDAHDASFVFHKAGQFAVEDEVRLFLVPRGRPHEQPFDAASLLRVILGRSISSYHEAIIRKWCRMRVPELPVGKQGDGLETRHASSSRS